MTSQSAIMRVPGKDDYINVHGMMVEKKAHAIVERIKDIDDSLEVLCVDPEQCGFAEAPFVLIEVRQTPEGPRALKVFDFWELNDSVVERVLMADSKRHDILELIDKNNKQVKDDLARVHRERRESKKDLIASIISSTKSSYSYVDEDRNAKVTIFEDGRLPKVESR